MQKQKANRVFPALVKSKMYEKGIKRDEMATYLHISVSTYQRRMNNPEEFTVANLMVFSEKLKIEKSSIVEAIL